ncbi:MAG: hypothetical protein PHS32_00485 [Rhodoferax sp.]|uniref:hypothetical protein n=1 Tax=Rhodoferax sp. TaxID=50421 RepID=UPI0026128A42|nr:hypothetical protein [Rhodoferax sp.]MDD5332193.1 hypothetical protein [Rhodoferax sp.]
MKLKGLIAAPAVALLVTALAAAPGTLPEGWLRTGSASGCRTSTEAVKDGPTPKAFVIECPKLTEGFATIMQVISAQDYAGKRVRLSAKVQGDSMQEWGGLWLRGDAGKDGNRVFDNMQTRPLKGSFGWREAEVVLDIPSDVDALNFGFLLYGEGTLRTTQFRLEVVPDTVPVTAGPKSVRPTRPINLSPQ